MRVCTSPLLASVRGQAQLRFPRCAIIPMSPTTTSERASLVPTGLRAGGLFERDKGKGPQHRAGRLGNMQTHLSDRTGAPGAGHTALTSLRSCWAHAIATLRATDASKTDPAGLSAAEEVHTRSEPARSPPPLSASGFSRQPLAQLQFPAKPPAPAAIRTLCTVIPHTAAFNRGHLLGKGLQPSR